MAEVVGFDDGVLVLVDVLAGGLEEDLVAEVLTEHVEDERALGVDIVGDAEAVVGVVVSVALHPGIAGR